MNFQQLKKTKPGRTINLPAGYFKESCDSPTPGTRIGVRRLSVLELDLVYSEAEQYKDLGEAKYHEALMLNIVASALTHPDDCSKRYLEAGDFEARQLFTKEGIAYLYDIVLQLHASTTPIYEEISDANIDMLIKLLKSKPISRKMRRMLSYLLDELCQ